VPFVGFPYHVPRRQLPSAPPRSPPPSSPARLRKCPGSTSCDTSYAPVLIPSKTTSSSRSPGRLAGVPRAPTGSLPLACRRCAASARPSSDLDRAIQIVLDPRVKPSVPVNRAAVTLAAGSRSYGPDPPLALTVRFCKENPEFFPICNPVLPP
jgi:hypothetical protein